MANSTVATVSTATPGWQEFLPLLQPTLLMLFGHTLTFRQQPPTPQQTHDFETGAGQVLREMGRTLADHEYNHIEPAQRQDCPLRMRLGEHEHRRRPQARTPPATLVRKTEFHRY